MSSDQTELGRRTWQNLSAAGLLRIGLPRPIAAPGYHTHIHPGCASAPDCHRDEIHVSGEAEVQSSRSKKRDEPVHWVFAWLLQILPLPVRRNHSLSVHLFPPCPSKLISLTRRVELTPLHSRSFGACPAASPWSLVLALSIQISTHSLLGRLYLVPLLFQQHSSR